MYLPQKIILNASGLKYTIYSPLREHIYRSKLQALTYLHKIMTERKKEKDGRQAEKLKSRWI